MLFEWCSVDSARPPPEIILASLRIIDNIMLKFCPYNRQRGSVANLASRRVRLGQDTRLVNIMRIMRKLRLLASILSLWST